MKKAGRQRFEEAREALPANGLQAEGRTVHFWWGLIKWLMILNNFICDAGTPCALIAKGILLSYQTDKTQIKLSLVITLLKIFIFPLILFVILYLINYDLNISRTTMMVAAAPIGAMGLVFASIYNVTTDAVVRSGIITYVLALLSIPIVGGITH